MIASIREKFPSEDFPIRGGSTGIVNVGREDNASFQESFASKYWLQTVSNVASNIGVGSSTVLAMVASTVLVASLGCRYQVVAGPVQLDPRSSSTK
ncbi:hypothetical protein M0802_005198 [Mischocyttarus mexicanus]|nr:hypothetical protein M0802_005198 [Mischocyttarus mexicanus]